MTFGFSLYIISLLVALTIYFGTELGNLIDEKPLENSKMYYYQYWR